jgi:hypothetical protein
MAAPCRRDDSASKLAGPLQHSLVNPLLEQLNASIAFIGCNGVSAAG